MDWTELQRAIYIRSFGKNAEVTLGDSPTREEVLRLIDEARSIIDDRLRLRISN